MRVKPAYWLWPLALWMALWMPEARADFVVKTGTRQALTATATDTVDIGFTPKALITINMLQTAWNDDGNNSNNGIGIAAGASEEFNLWWSEIDASATGVNSSCIDSFLFTVRNSGGGSIVNKGSIVNFNDSGFHISWTVGSSGRKYAFLALGGSDITNVKVGFDTVATSTGDKSYTGIGFKPDLLIILKTDAMTTFESGGYGLGMSFGAASSATDEAVCLSWTSYNEDSSDAKTYQKSGAILAGMVEGNPASVNSEAQLTSFDSDGFTLNYSAVTGTKVLFAYLAIKGGSYKVGLETAKTSTGTKATTGVGFLPKALMLVSAMDTAAASVTKTGRVSVGFASGTGDSTNYSIIQQSEDSVTTSNTGIIGCDTLCIYCDKTIPPGTSAVPEAGAKLSSFDSDGFTMNWVYADSARQFIYVAFGSDTPGALKIGTTKLRSVKLGTP